MLASITPLGERARHARWGVTVTAFLVGALAAATATGAVIGGLGSVLLSGAVGMHARLVILAAAALAAIALDAIPGGVPGPRRQVNERWLDQYRGWVYGLGFGAQLGLGVTTVVSSAATYLALLAAFLIGSPLYGALVVGWFGVVRGLTPLASAGVSSPRQLMAVHATLARWRIRVRWGAVVALGAILLGSLLEALG